MTMQQLEIAKTNLATSNKTQTYEKNHFYISNYYGDFTHNNFCQV